MFALLSLASLLLYAIVVSQPFFYLLALGTASSSLSATAYIELRQQINRAITTRLTRLYVTTLVVTAGLVVVAIMNGSRTLAALDAIAVACLVGDSVLAVKRNVPINTVMDAWTTTNYPDDWATHRDAWNEAFALRQVVLGSGFCALCLGIVAAW